MLNNSIHLNEYSDQLILSSRFDSDLIKKMNFTREICSSILSFRKSSNIRVRMPLKAITIYTKEKIEDFYLNIITDEVNVKSIKIEDKNFKDVANEDITLNMKSLGLKFKDGIKKILESQKSKNWTIVDDKLNIAGLIIGSEDFQISYKPKESNLNILSTKGNQALIQIDSSFDRDLEIEGFVRDLIRKIQSERKRQNFNLDDRIIINVKTNYKNFRNDIIDFIENIKNETLANEIVFSIENQKQIDKITDADAIIECQNDKK